MINRWWRRAAPQECGWRSAAGTLSLHLGQAFLAYSKPESYKVRTCRRLRIDTIGSTETVVTSVSAASPHQACRPVLRRRGEIWLVQSLRAGSEQLVFVRPRTVYVLATSSSMVDSCQSALSRGLRVDLEGRQGQGACAALPTACSAFPTNLQNAQINSI